MLDLGGCRAGEMGWTGRWEGGEGFFWWFGKGARDAEDEERRRTVSALAERNGAARRLRHHARHAEPPPKIHPSRLPAFPLIPPKRPYATHFLRVSR